MVAPTKAWTAIPDTDVDADSPLTQQLMTAIRDNQIHLEERMGGQTANGTPAQNHAHLGTDGSARISGASGGTQIAVGYRNPTGDAKAFDLCRFKPEVMWAISLNNASGTANQFQLKHIGDSVGFATVGTGAKSSNPDIEELIEGGFYLSTGGVGSLNVAAKTLCSLLFKSRTGFIKYGTYVGTGATLDVTGLGFQPEFVMVWRATDGTTSIPVVKTVGHATNDSMDWAGNQLTDAIRNLLADGFRVSTNTKANAAGITYAYIAWKAGSFDGEQIKRITYSGNGSANRTLTGVGFRPQFVFITRTDAGGAGQQPVLMFSNMQNTESRHATGATTTAILEMKADGFSIGNDSRVNNGAGTYDAWSMVGGVLVP